MNNFILLANCLERLAKLASQASNDFERASVFSAAKAIEAEFDKNQSDFDGYVLEKATAACWHICVAVGYGISNGHSESMHVGWAYVQISSLQNVLSNLD